MGDRLRGFIPSFAAIFVLSALCQYVSEALPPIKTAGLESVLLSVILGLSRFRNTVGLPKWLSPAVRSEYCIKIGLILLGTSVLFGETLKAGDSGMLQAVVVVFTVWVFHFLARQKAKAGQRNGHYAGERRIDLRRIGGDSDLRSHHQATAKSCLSWFPSSWSWPSRMMYLMPLLAKWTGTYAGSGGEHGSGAPSTRREP